MDRIIKQIDVHMYAMVCCSCTKFEKNRSRHLQETAADGRTDRTQSISPRSGLRPRGLMRDKDFPVRESEN